MVDYCSWHMFIPQESLLRATKYLPGIIKFQRMVKEQVHRCKNRDRIQDMTFNTFINEVNLYGECKFMLQWL